MRKKIIFIFALFVLGTIAFLLFYKPVELYSGQKIKFYQEVLDKLHYNVKKFIPVYAVNEDCVYFVVYDNNRKLKELYKVIYNERDKLLRVSSLYHFGNTYELYSNNKNQISFKPYLNEHISKPNDNLPHSQYKRELNEYYEKKHLLEESKKIEYTFNLKEEDKKNNFNSELLGDNAKNNFYNLLASFLNDKTSYERKEILSSITTEYFLDESILIKLQLEQLQKERKTRVDLEKYEKIYTIKKVITTSKVYLFPNSNEYLINEKYTKISGEIHPHQM